MRGEEQLPDSQPRLGTHGREHVAYFATCSSGSLTCAFAYFYIAEI